MQFDISRKELLDGLVLLQLSGKARQPSPISQFLKLEASTPDSLTLSACDLEIFFNARVNADIATEGSCLLPGRKLYDLLRHLPEGPVHFLLEENHYASIQCKNCHIRLAGSSTEEFPSFPESHKEAQASLCLPLEDLSDMLKTVLFCVNETDARAALTGVLVQTVVSKKDPSICYLRAVSSDGHRLALSQVPLKNAPTGLFPEEGVLLPKRACQEIVRLSQNKEDRLSPIFVEFLPSLVRVFTDRLKFISRYIEASFPPYQTLLDRPSATTRAKLKRQVLLDSLKRFQAFTSPLYPDISFQLSPECIALKSYNPEVGEMREEVPLDENPGEPVLISFNARSMLECLVAFPGQEVWMSLWGREEPAILRSSTSKERGELLALIMPIQGPES
jgi:DNA polymerase-3 subunit beta